MYLCTVLYISLISEAETDRQIETKKKTQTVDRQTDPHPLRTRSRHSCPYTDTCTPWCPPTEGEVPTLPASSVRGRRTGNRSGCPARPGHVCACEKQLPAALWAAVCDHPCPQCHPLPATATMGCPCCHQSSLHICLPSEGRDSNTGEWHTPIHTTSSCFMPGLKKN